MQGNVWEWCQDLYSPYSSGSVIDPKGASSGSSRINRGGAWDYLARDSRSAIRHAYGQTGIGDSLGFRLVKYAKQSINVTGYWKVYYTEDGLEVGPINCELNQTEDTVTGESKCGNPIAINGQTNGNSISLKFNDGDGETVFLSGEVNINSMNGSYFSTNGQTGTWRAEKTEELLCGSWNSYIGYWTGVVTNDSNTITTVEISIWQNGDVEWRAASSACTGGGNLDTTVWSDNVTQEGERHPEPI